MGGRNFVLDTLKELYGSQYVLLAGITILYYDHLITLPQEIRCIWKARLTFANSLFLLNRYLVFFGYIPFLYFQFNSPVSPMPCKLFTRTFGSFMCITQAIIAVLLMLRCYALYHGKTFILLGMGLLGLSTIATSAWAVSRLRANVVPFGFMYSLHSCDFTQPIGGTAFKLQFSLSFVFEFLVFLLTVLKTYQLRLLSRRAELTSQLIELLMRDGSLYFASLAVINIANLILFIQAASAFTGNFSVITHSISVTLISRLMLNLHGLDTASSVTNEDTELDTMEYGQHTGQQASTNHTHGVSAVFTGAGWSSNGTDGSRGMVSVGSGSTGWSHTGTSGSVDLEEKQRIHVV